MSTKIPTLNLVVVGALSLASTIFLVTAVLGFLDETSGPFAARVGWLVAAALVETIATLALVHLVRPHQTNPPPPPTA